MSEEDFKKYETSYRQYYGSNYDKALRNLKNTKKRMERQFVQQYPNAHLDKFKFNVILSKTGDVTGTSVSFKVRDGQFLDITTDDFKKFYSGELHWLPRIWDTSGTVQPFALSSSSLPYNYKKFTIYVNANSGFTSNFDALSTSWKGTNNDITKAAVDKDDPYFASLLAAYIISHVGGMSRKHLTGDNNVVTSIARYCIYYHMKRFTGTPEKMSPYITHDIKRGIQQNTPHKRIWVHKFERTRSEINYWYSRHANKNNIRNYRYRMSANNTGVLGIDYEEVSKVVNDSDNDWMKFIKDDSDGLTKTGQILVQSAIESYVYCVLGAQAQTRWPIVGQGAKSLQTQQIFHRLVKDTVAQDNPSKAISDMRKAIQDTNVVLNMAITPGIILIPSNMIISKNKVEGYNNVLTIATNAMKFGVNTKVNYVAPKVTKKPTQIITEKPPIPPTTTTKPQTPIPTVKPNSGNHLPYLLGSTIGIGFLITKFVL